MFLFLSIMKIKITSQVAELRINSTPDNSVLYAEMVPEVFWTS